MSEDRRRTWRENLSKALRSWCERNGYVPRNKLAKELKISEAAWTGIIVGNNISENTEVYAKIFARTALPQSDPRTVPPHRKALPKGGSMEVEQAWSEGQWQDWQRRSRVHPERASIPQPAEPVGLPVGSPLDLLFDYLASRVAERLLPHLRGTSGHFAEAPFREVATQFHRLLQEVAEGTPEDQENFLNENGRFLIGEVMPLLTALTRPTDKERKQLLQLRGGRQS